MRIYLLLIQNRFKLLFRDRIIIGLFFVLCLIFFLSINTLTNNISLKSSVPVGIIDNDNTLSSKRVLEELKNSETLFVYSGDEDYIDKLLKDRIIQITFIIKEDFQKNIQNGKTDKLITVNYLNGSKAFKILSDIVAGEFMYEVCMAKSYNELVSLFNKNREDKVVDNKEFLYYTDSIKNSNLFDFHFDISYLNPQNSIEKEEVDNSIIYKYVIGCILSGFLMFILLFLSNPIIKDRELLIDKRLKVNSISKVKTIISDFIVMVIMGTFFCFVTEFMLYFSIGFSEYRKILSLLVLTLNFVFVYSLLFILIAQISKSMGMVQLFGTIIILSTIFASIIGFLFEIIYNKILIFSKIIPNYWYIVGFTDIITGTSFKILNQNVIVLMAIGCILFLINILISKLKLGAE